MGAIGLQIGLVLLVSTCLFAMIKGDAGERFGATAVAVTWIGSSALYAITTTHTVWFLIFDVALAMALLVIAIRYSSIWLGVAMVLQAFALALHSMELGDGGLSARTYFVLINLSSALMLAAIAISTAGSWMKRVKARKAQAAKSTRPEPPPSAAATPA